MVVVAPNSRKRNNTRIVAIAASVMVVGVCWLVASSSFLVGERPGVRKAPSSHHHVKKSEEVATEEATAASDGLTARHLSAEVMLASKRPYIMYGTAWKEDGTADLVYQAVHAGFRFIDTACQPKHYDEAGVGYGWKTAADEMGLKRTDVYLQTKFTPPSGQDQANMPYEAGLRLEAQVSRSIFVSLRNLQTTYIDSLVLHSPMPTMDETLRAWKVMEDHVKDGKVRSLGISNCYDPKVFAELYEKAKVKPRVLQNRFYSESNFDVELRKVCKELGVAYQSFWTLSANLGALSTPEWRAAATGKGLSPQTLMYAYVMALGHTPLSGTKDPGHMREDVDVVLRFQRGERVLNDGEMEKLSSLLGIPGHSEANGL
jgi:diketogulonate reductase-like aldo/keto reductase